MPPVGRPPAGPATSLTAAAPQPGAGLSEASGTAYLAHVIGFVVGAALVWRLRSSRRAFDRR